VSAQTVLDDLADALDQVTGLAAHSKHPENIKTPAAICELASITAPSTLGTVAEYTVRVILAVQVGDKRNSQERTLALIDPAGTVATSALVALLSDDPVRQVLFEGPGLIGYGDQQFHGGVFTVNVLA
jgi:hypothetical protein